VIDVPLTRVIGDVWPVRRNIALSVPRKPYGDIRTGTGTSQAPHEQ